MTLSRPRLIAVCLFFSVQVGCARAPDNHDIGPGHREQALALSPAQELALGTKVYRQILSEASVLPAGDARVAKVREIGRRIAQAAEIRPLQREINLHIDPAFLRWEFNGVNDKQVNAFCLPGGKVGVLTGLLHIVENDDQLATVLGHEIAHALAHHASERLARQQLLAPARAIAQGDLDSVNATERGALVSLLAFGGSLRGLAFDRFQESEADHIGTFLMTFAGYDPRQALVFWERMEQLSQRGGRLPEILSDHPSDARRMAQLRAWVPRALSGKKAFDEGRIAPQAR